jgi:micrococcal nuclease
MGFFQFRHFTILVIVLLFISSCTSVKYENIQVIDGDTLSYNEEIKVRLLQIDTPEIQDNECYAQEAKQELIRIVSTMISGNTQIFSRELINNNIRMESDDLSGNKDKYDRELRYLFIGDLNVNLEMVKRGAAAPYFYNGQRGKFYKELLEAAQEARALNLGLWGACPSTILDPNAGVRTSSAIEPIQDDLNKFSVGIVSGGSNCDPNYEGCIPIFPPDLDCPDIRALGLAPIHRIGGDPHRLDRDGDGVGCE